MRPSEGHVASSILAGRTSISLVRARSAQSLAALTVALLVGCASAPPVGAPDSSTTVTERPGPALGNERDGPDAQPPPDLAKVPDAEPRVEPIRIGGPNKPYEIEGRTYVPITDDRTLVEKGLASWYGRKFHGRRTSSGELYNMYEMTAAHPTLPIPSYARIRNPANGREVVVRVNDRGPFSPGRIVDLSYTAAFKLGVLGGVTPVELERITYQDIRSGAWRRDAPEPAAQTQLAARGPPAPAAPPPADAAASAPSQPLPPPDTAKLDESLEPPRRAYTREARGYWVQIGAFRERSGAENFQRRVAAELAWLAPLLAIFNETSVHRLQAGPYANRDEAGSASQRIREALQLVPVIVERR